MCATEKSPLLLSKMSDTNDATDKKKNDGLLTEVLKYFIQVNIRCNIYIANNISCSLNHTVLLLSYHSSWDGYR